MNSRTIVFVHKNYLKQGSSVGGIISKFKNLGFGTFSKLYNNGEISISDYASGIWGYKNSRQAKKIQNRVCRYLLSVNAKTPLSALHRDMGLTRPKYRMYLTILRFYNCLIKIKNDRLIFNKFEYDLQNISNDNWSGDLEKVNETAELSIKKVCQKFLVKIWECRKNKLLTC